MMLCGDSSSWPAWLAAPPALLALNLPGAAGTGAEPLPTAAAAFAGGPDAEDGAAGGGGPDDAAGGAGPGGSVHAPGTRPRPARFPVLRNCCRREMAWF